VYIHVLATETTLFTVLYIPNTHQLITMTI